MKAQTIRPHNKEVLDTLIGSLLGDGYAEKRNGTARFVFHYSSRNMAYLHFLHEFFSSRGYMSAQFPTVHTQIGSQGKRYFCIRFRTYSYRSLSYLYDWFYQEKNGKMIKKVPEHIDSLLSPRALAIWLMDDGSISGKDIRISTNSFHETDLHRVQNAFKHNFDIDTTLHKQAGRFVLYVSKQSVNKLQTIVKPYFIPSMLYKLHL